MMKTKPKLESKKDQLETKNGNSSLVQNESEENFMLAELVGARELVELRRKRGEQAILFCVTFWTALIGAFIATFTSKDINATDIIWIYFVILIVFSIIGHITFGAFISAITASTISRSKYLAIQQYFLEKYTATKNFLRSRADDELLNSWKAVYRRGVIIFLRAFLFCNALVLTLGISLIYFKLMHNNMPRLITVLKLDVFVLVLIILGFSIFVQEKFISHSRMKIKNEFCKNLIQAGIKPKPQQ